MNTFKCSIYKKIKSVQKNNGTGYASNDKRKSD